MSGLRIHAFSAVLAVFAVLAWYELNAIAVGDFPHTITWLVTSTDLSTVLAVVVAFALAVATAAHFAYERWQRIHGR